MSKENQNIEWKESWHDDYLKWICGYANAQGGKLYIGKDDNGKVVGIKNAHKLLEDLPNKIINHLGIFSEVNLKEDNGKEYIEIVVANSSYPVSYRGKYYYRSGSTMQVFKGLELSQFLMKKTGVHWEDAVVDNLNAADFRNDSFDIFREKAVINGRLSELDLKITNKQLLHKLDLYDDDSLTRAAVLIFYHNLESIVPGSFIKIAYFKNDTDILFQDEIHGPLISQVDNVINLLFSKYLIAKIGFQDIVRVEKYPYPKEAVREAVLNAIVHKNYAKHNPTQIRVYEDKLMITNSCVLPENWTVDSLINKQNSDSYNPRIALTFARAGFIESWGRGIQSIFRSCENYGIDKPLYSGDQSFITVEFKTKTKACTQKGTQKRNQNSSKLDDEQAKQGNQECTQENTQIRIIRLMKEKPYLNIRQIAEELNLNLNTTKSSILRMEKKKIVKRVKEDGLSLWVVLI